MTTPRFVLLATWQFAVALCIAPCTSNVSAAVIYNEAVSGDLPFDFATAPTLNLHIGSNEVLGSMGLLSTSNVDGDVIRFVVPVNTRLTAVTVSATRTMGGLVSTGWGALDANFSTLGNFTVNVPTTNQALLTTLMPIGPGTYAFYNGGYGFAPPLPAFANYTFTFTVASVPGSSQGTPILPTSQLPDGTFVFNNVPSGSWFDPPLVSGFHYEMTTPGSFFTGITGFPTGFNGPFTVSTNGSVLGQFLPGQTLTFPGSGVASFDVTGIQPLADAANPTAFPLQLTFSTPTASFTMQGIQAVPEPATFAMWVGSAIVGLAAGARAAVGQRVRIIRGMLAGLLGTVEDVTAACRCVLAIDGLPEGVHVVVDGAVLEAEPEEAPQ